MFSDHFTKLRPQFLILLILFSSISILAQETVTPPKFKECLEYVDTKEIKACVSKRISNLIRKKLKVEKFQSQLHPGNNLIMVDFIIEKDKTINYFTINHPNEEIRNQIEKILSKIKFHTPAMHDGKAINIFYTIPIVIRELPSRVKPNPLYKNSGLALDNSNVENAQVLKYNLDEKLNKKIEFRDFDEIIKRRYLSSLYNNINIYKISSYLEKGTNTINASFTINKNRELINLSVHSNSEHVSNYIKEVIQKLPKLSPVYKDKEPEEAHYKLVLAYKKESN